MFRWLTESPEASTRRAALRQLGGAALVLLAAGFLVRLVLRFVARDQDDVVYGLCVYGVILILAAVFAFRWATTYPMRRVWAYLAVAAAPAALLIGVFGAWVSGQSFADSQPIILALRVLLTYAVMGAGAVIGVLATVALGRDLTSRAWDAHARKLRNLRGPVKPRA